MDELKPVTIAHARACKMCVRGVKRFCLRHGLDFKLLTTGSGMPAKDLLATGDAMARQAVEKAQNG